MVLFSLPFCAVGLWAVWQALQDPTPVGLVTGSLFAAGGFGFLFFGRHLRAREEVQRELYGAIPNSPGSGDPSGRAAACPARPGPA